VTVWTLSGQRWMMSRTPRAAISTAAAFAGVVGSCVMMAFAMPITAARRISTQPAGLCTPAGYESRSSPTPGAR